MPPFGCPLSCPPELPRAADTGEGGPVPKWVGRATVVNGRARTAVSNTATSGKPPVTLDGLTLPDAPSLLVDVKGVVMQANPAAVELAGAQGADDTHAPLRADDIDTVGDLQWRREVDGRAAKRGVEHDHVARTETGVRRRYRVAQRSG